MCVKLNQQYFINTNFLTSVFNLKTLPKDNCTEVAFAGCSNSGKSSVINVVVQKNNLALTSKTPGRTQSINYFQVADNKYLVDLPGYGYAKVPSQEKKKWATLIENYLTSRHSLTGIILIMDIRHPLKEFDKQMLFFCANNQLPLYIILNKSDKLTTHQINTTTKDVSLNIQEYNKNKIIVQPFSAIKKHGIKELQDHIINWLDRKSLL